MSERARQYFAIPRYALATACSEMCAGVTNSAALFKLLKPCCCKWCFSVSCLKHYFFNFTCHTNHWIVRRKANQEPRGITSISTEPKLVRKTNEKYIFKIWTCGVTLKSLNAPVKGVFNYLHTNSSCHLWSSLLLQHTLGKSVFPVFKTMLVPLFWTTLQNNHHVPECWRYLQICGPSNGSSVLGNVKRHIGPNMVIRVGGPNLLLIFRPKTSIQRACYEQRHCQYAWSQHYTKVYKSSLMNSFM